MPIIEGDILLVYTILEFLPLVLTKISLKVTYYSPNILLEVLWQDNNIQIETDSFLKCLHKFLVNNHVLWVYRYHTVQLFRSFTRYLQSCLYFPFIELRFFSILSQFFHLHSFYAAFLSHIMNQLLCWDTQLLYVLHNRWPSYSSTTSYARFAPGKTSLL
jgi:hypothetical protein